MSLAPAPVAGPGFAVIDFETTGLLPEYHHRAVEVAVVHVDPDGIVTGQWDTLINPRRDLGPQRIQGMSSKYIFGAPFFEEVASHLIEFLSGRVIIGHNASFDMRFLDADMDRLENCRRDPWASACSCCSPVGMWALVRSSRTGSTISAS
ncbi:PolC-type DNA polymerase III, partial [Microbacterium sp. B19]|uniref:3'-5' exonuclease n=1 Tax=Microbacterium sp. B19 TaxID=96765 RepID=UPI0023BAAD49